MAKPINIPQGLNEFEKIPNDENRVVVNQFLDSNFNYPGLYILQHHNKDNIHTKNLFKIGTAQNLKQRLGNYAGYIPEGIFVKAVVPMPEKIWQTELSGKINADKRKKRIDNVSKLVKQELEYQGGTILSGRSGQSGVSDWVSGTSLPIIKDAIGQVSTDLKRRGNDLTKIQGGALRVVPRNTFTRATRLVANTRREARDEREREDSPLRRRRVNAEYEATLGKMIDVVSS